MAKYKWGKTSIRRKKRLSDNLNRVIDRFLSYGYMDASVLCTVRSKSEQNKYYRTGKSKVFWPNGKHNIIKKGDKAKAVDIAPWVNGKVSYNREQCCVMVGLLLAAAKEENVNVRSGSNWDRDDEFLSDQDFDDIIHLEEI